MEDLDKFKFGENMGENEKVEETGTRDRGGDFEEWEKELQKKMEILEEAQKQGQKEEELVFGRRSSITRTPPKSDENQDRPYISMIHRRSNSVGAVVREGDPVSNLTFKRMKEKEVDEGTGKQGEQEQEAIKKQVQTEKDRKRAREETTPDLARKKEKVEEQLDKTKWMGQILKNIGLLRKLVSESYNPKKELTDISSKLSYLAERITDGDQKDWMREMHRRDQQLEQMRSENADLRNQIKSLKQLEKPKAKEVTTVTIGLQADMRDIIREQEAKERQIREKITKTLEEDKAYEKLTQIIDENWPEDTFKRTKICLEDPQSFYQPGSDENVVLFIDPNYAKDETKAEALKNKIPAIKHLLEEELREGNMEFLKLQTEIRKGRSNDQMHYANAVYALPITMGGSDVVDTEVMYKLVTQLQQELSEYTGCKLRVLTTAQMNLDYVRKTLEFIFRSTDTLFNVVGKHEERNSGWKKARPEKAKVIVKAQPGKSYADLVRSVKESVNVEEKGIVVKSIKKTSGGDLLLEVTGGKSKALALQQDIQQNNRNADVVIKTNEVTVHITDIDASITKGELQQEIMKAEGLPENQLKVVSMRPTRNGNQTATVVLTKDAAKKVVNRGTIKIGWVCCRVRKRVSLQRCYRCHLFGHKREECENEDRSDLCLKCLKPGHTAKDCRNTPVCVICTKDGHHADQTKCPVYRRLIEEKTRPVPATRIKERGRKPSVHGN